jgi:hypothetical protein
LAAAGVRAGTNVVPTLAVVAVDAAGTAVFAAVDAVGLANGVAAANDPDVLSVAIGCATLSVDVAGGALTLEAGGRAALAAATAAATAALALAIAAIASFETGLALAAEVVASGTFFLQAAKEPSATTAHDASKKRNPICNLRPSTSGRSRAIGASCLKGTQ